MNHAPESSSLDHVHVASFQGVKEPHLLCHLAVKKTHSSSWQSPGLNPQICRKNDGNEQKELEYVLPLVSTLQ